MKPEETRISRRKEYWDLKYYEADWVQDLHFALPTTVSRHCGSTAMDLQAGVESNTHRAYHELLEQAPLYSLTTKARILDFACGSGDLLLEFLSHHPDCTAIGIDISSSAIDLLRERSKSRCLNCRLSTTVGGVDALADIPDMAVDVLIFRDACYLLSEDEQESFFLSCARILRPAGVLFVADLAMNVDLCGERECEALRSSICERQFAGRMLTMWRDRGEINVGWLGHLAERSGLRLLVQPRTDEGAVYHSYDMAAALSNVDPGVREHYIRLAELARPRSNRSALPYMRLFFGRNNDTDIVTEDDCKVVLHRPLLRGRKTLLRKGTYSFARGKWTLIVGRSGEGKSSLLEEIAFNQHDVSLPVRRFLLTQQPQLVGELSVKANLLIYGSDEDSFNVICQLLGFDDTFLARRAESGLSGGEQQRVALGQALLSTADLLLLDEPFSGIDPSRKRAMLTSLRRGMAKLNRMCTCICVDHDFVSYTEYFDEILELGHRRLLKVPDSE